MASVPGWLALLFMVADISSGWMLTWLLKLIVLPKNLNFVRQILRVLSSLYFPVYKFIKNKMRSNACFQNTACGAVMLQCNTVILQLYCPAEAIISFKLQTPDYVLSLHWSRIFHVVWELRNFHHICFSVSFLILITIYFTKLWGDGGGAISVGVMRVLLQRKKKILTTSDL